MVNEKLNINKNINRGSRKLDIWKESVDLLPFLRKN